MNKTIKGKISAAAGKLKKSGIPNPFFEAETLLSFVLKKGREHILAHPYEKISLKDIGKFDSYIKRRLENEPLSYITGLKEFYGLSFFVNKNVLIPRPETEMMIDELLNISKNLDHPVLVDIGAGAGPIAVTAAKKTSIKKIYAIDICKKALKVALKNAEYHRVKNKIKFLPGDLLSPFKKEKIDPKSNIVIAANLPYLTEKQIKNSLAIKKEPRKALYGGKDGLEYYEKLFKQISSFNKFNIRYILCEIDPGQKDKMKRLAKGYFPKGKMEIKKDLAGRDRLLKVKK